MTDLSQKKLYNFIVYGPNIKTTASSFRYSTKERAIAAGEQFVGKEYPDEINYSIMTNSRPHG